MTKRELINKCLTINNDPSKSTEERGEDISLMFTSAEYQYSKAKARKLIREINKLGLDTTALEIWNETRDQ